MSFPGVTRPSPGHARSSGRKATPAPRGDNMSDAGDWNTKTIAEFRENDGRVGGPFEGAPLVLVHHRGRKSGREYVTPVMYLPDQRDPNGIYVFASKGGTPENPDWYYNLTSTGEGNGRARHRHLPSLGQRGDRHRARSHLRRTGRGATPASPSTHDRPKASGGSRCSCCNTRSGPSRPATASPQLAPRRGTGACCWCH